jgi:hypothetical protein
MIPPAKLPQKEKEAEPVHLKIDDSELRDDEKSK